MEFSVGSESPIQNPTAEQVEAGLRSLTGEGDSFAILAESEMTYLQTSGSPTEGFVLEYQLGSIDQHFRSTCYDLPLGTVSEAFNLYLVSDSGWRDVTSWEREDLGTTGGVGIVPFVLVGILIVAAAIWWFRAA